MYIKNKIKNFTNFQNIKFGYILVILFLTNTSLPQSTNTTFKQKLGNLLLLPISSSYSSDKLIKKADAIATKLNPQADITIKQLNTFGKLLVGYKNSLSIPFFNYILVNENWLKTLPSKAEDFILARSVIYLLNYTYAYPIYKYIFPLLIHNFFLNFNEYLTYYTTNISQSQKKLIFYISLFLAKLLPSYYLRKIEYSIDKQAAIKYKCLDGAILAILDSIKYSHNGSLLDKLNSKISIADFISLTLFCTQFYIDLQHLKPLPKFLQPFSTVKIGEFYFPLLFFLNPNQMLPGTFSDRSSASSNFIKNLPLVNLMFNFPKPYKRIRELTELRNKLLREKIKENRLETK